MPLKSIDIAVKKEKHRKGQPLQREIGVEYDRNSVRQDIESFVSSYNQFYQVSKDLAVLTQQQAKGAPLSGMTVRYVCRLKAKGVFSSSVGAWICKSLTEFGITTTGQGSLRSTTTCLTVAQQQLR